ncbi:MAG: hypothetical protein AAGH78_12510 [Cyanobacteria bacterium P01_H01_bin.58]
MKSNDWFIGFLIGICLLMAQAGYLAHRTGISHPLYRWAQGMVATALVK